MSSVRGRRNGAFPGRTVDVFVRLMDVAKTNAKSNCVERANAKPNTEAIASNHWPERASAKDSAEHAEGDWKMARAQNEGPDHPATTALLLGNTAR